jgi:hypothetical protein
MRDIQKNQYYHRDRKVAHHSLVVSPKTRGASHRNRHRHAEKDKSTDKADVNGGLLGWYR